MIETMEKTLPVTSAREGAPSGASRGFTLIEILIVVALLAIFAVVAIPNVRRARIRAHMLEQVRTLKQAAALGRINAIRSGRQLVLGMPTGDGVTIRLWADANSNEAYDAGERVFHDWVLPSDIEVKADTSRALRSLDGGGKGIVFRADGVVEASSSKDDTGWGAVILEDSFGNDVRVSFAGGTGTVIVEMKSSSGTSGTWSTELKEWRS